MGTDFEEIGALSSQSLDWGPGGPVDEKNRSQGAILYNEKYGGYDALFLAADEPVVYMTFDEGYEYGLTPTFLSILKEKDVKGLFFVTYDFAARQPELVQQIIDEGHVLGNHSWSHKNYSTLTPKEAAEDLMKLHDYIKENFGYEMKYFRFPSGNFNEQTLAVVQSMGYKSVFWSFAYQDWLTDGVNVWKGRDLVRLEEKLRGILTKQLPDLTGAGRRVAEARSLPRIGQALQQFYATLPAPQRNARPTPQRRTA